MELKKFITESVREIMSGVVAAQTEKHKYGIDNDNGHGIEFDVAVNVNSSIEGKAGISVLEIGVSSKGNVSESSTHRIKFTVIPRGRRQKK